MNPLYSNTPKPRFAHLSLKHYRVIQSEINSFLAAKTKGKTVFLRKLARHINTSLSNLYTILDDGMVTVLTSALTQRTEFSAEAAFNRRSTRSANSSKHIKAAAFLEAVVREFQDPDNLSSIDEIVQSIRIHDPDRFAVTVCMKTLYAYVHTGRIAIKPIDCPRMSSLRHKRPPKPAKRQKGVSIDQRPFAPDDRSEFGHWEGDCVVGKRDKDVTLFTLVERKTRFQIILRLQSRSAKQVVMAISKLEKRFGREGFKTLFKSITLDNGNEFARYQDIEQRPGCSIRRTSVYFAHPYASWERGSNEHGNGLIRRRIPKGGSISGYTDAYIQKTAAMINQKKRKIHNYVSSAGLFKLECALCSMIV